MTAKIFDTETHDKENPQIIEYAWLDVEFGRPVVVTGGESGKLQPSEPIKLGALSTHHIMDEDLVDCDPSAMFTYPATDYTIGHNVDYDWSAAGCPETLRIDTCALARSIWPYLDCYSQSALIYFLDRENARERLKAAHGAAADVVLCKTILDEIITLSDAQSWEELWKQSEIARVPTTFTFGKHKGMKIEETPASYRRWMLNANDPPIDEYLRKAINISFGEKGLL